MQVDSETLKAAKEFAQQIRSAHTERDRVLLECEMMYKLKWDDENKFNSPDRGMKVTKSPDPRNAVLGAIRLLTAADPVFSVGGDTNKGSVKGVADKLERWATTIWRAGGRTRGDPIHLDVVRSAVIYGEFIIAVTSADDMVQATAPGSAARARAEEVQRRAPYLFEVVNPRSCYPVWDGIGLRTMYRESSILVGEVIDRFGEDGKAAVGAVKRDIGRFETVTLCDLWDLETRTLWIKEAAGDIGVIAMGEHGLPFIPFVAHLVEGSRLFEKLEDQREPFLYTLIQTGLWKRQNLSLTAMYNMIESMGLNPIFVHKQGSVGSTIRRDYSVPGGTWEIPPGDDLVPVTNKGIIDPAVMQGLEIAERKGAESTMYRQALGEPVTNGSVAFSTISLLAQSGRLPLVTAQRKAGWGIADAAKIALQWTKHDGKKRAVKYGDATVDLAPAEIPGVFELECKLDISLPQDRLSLANIANMLVDRGLASPEWARKEILQIEQSGDMDTQIWEARAAETIFGALMMEKAMQYKQADNPADNPADNMPMGRPAPGPGTQAGLPPAMAAPGANAPIMTEQMPPEMGGGMPPEMMGGMPG